MDWNDFLEYMSDRFRLTPEQREVFVARLADENRDKSNTALATMLNLSEASVKKHLNAVYTIAGHEFPSLADVKGRGK
ncbi:MAG: hypothetical protein AAGD25_41070, partial [Cyanobacteria bacterium P01_F01_bin.150]